MKTTIKTTLAQARLQNAGPVFVLYNVPLNATESESPRCRPTRARFGPEWGGFGKRSALLDSQKSCSADSTGKIYGGDAGRASGLRRSHSDTEFHAGNPIAATTLLMSVERGVFDNPPASVSFFHDDQVMPQMYFLTGQAFCVTSSISERV